MMSDTKEYIIDKAFDLFLVKSYEAVSISDISKAIGFTKGALYHHFKNKEELFKAVLDKYLVFTSTDGDENKISLKDYNLLVIKNAEKLMLQLFSRSTKFSPINYLTLVADGFKHYPGFATEKETFFNAEITKTRQILDNAKARGEIRPEINTSVMAVTYFSVCVGMAGNLLQNYSLQDAIQSLKQQLDELLKLMKI